MEDRITVQKVSDKTIYGNTITVKCGDLENPKEVVVENTYDTGYTFVRDGCTWYLLHTGDVVKREYTTVFINLNTGESRKTGSL